MDRSNHYEAAFEAYLNAHRLGYIAVDESHRTWAGEVRVKNLDFVVYGPAGARLLVDVKGRRFPTLVGGKLRRVWECWSTQDDLDGLASWKEQFGPDYNGVLVFAFCLRRSESWPEDTEDLWTWHGRRYLYRAVLADDYRRHMRPRSPRWGTVCLPQPAFRELAQPFHRLTQAQSVPEDYPCPP